MMMKQDTNISKANIKPSHVSKNVFQYLMDDVNEWSTEYNVKVGSFSNLPESPHSWDKKVLNITPIKSGRNYRFRLGLQMYRMKTNESYSLIVELYNRDYVTWQRQQTFVNGTGMWVRDSNTIKEQYHYGRSNTLYYTKTLIKFKKTSSSPPIFVYYTVHFDDDGGDLNTYAKEFKNQIYLVAYGVEGLTDHVDSEVYDAHEAFEIDKTKMKMLVPLDMNGKKIMNTSFDLKLGDIFKVIKCTVKNFIYSSDIFTDRNILIKKENQNFSISSPVFIHSILFIIINQTNKLTSTPRLLIIHPLNNYHRIFFGNYEDFLEELTNKRRSMFSKSITFYAPKGIKQIQINDLDNKLEMELHLLISYI